MVGRASGRRKGYPVEVRISMKAQFNYYGFEVHFIVVHSEAWVPSYVVIYFNTIAY